MKLLSRTGCSAPADGLRLNSAAGLGPRAGLCFVLPAGLQLECEHTALSSVISSYYLEDQLYGC